MAKITREGVSNATQSAAEITELTRQGKKDQIYNPKVIRPTS
jgi:hypothetical protein